MAAYEPRASVGHGLGYATAPRGACHLDGGYVVYFELLGPLTLDPFHYRSKPGWVILDQNLLGAISSGGNCLFTAWTFVPNIAYRLPGHKLLSTIITKILTYTFSLVDIILKLPTRMLRFHLPMLPHSRAIKHATGMNMYFGKFIKAGARGYALERLFNMREGIGREEDKLPKRFTEEPLIEGKKKSVIRLDKMLPKYYKIRGWDKDGIPKKKTLKNLGLDFVDLSSIRN